ncbi:hypothetical protein F5H01DRAFT_12061 [Linnemannia elongata]|nr:hypothetical protein F5H01DRAFT_12061 [Linnemannia elongata]
MSKSPPPAIHHPSRKRPSLIDIPEILERIFYFTDDFTLRRTAILVCRHWLHMNINRIPRTVYYKNELRMRLRQPELVVSRLTGATRLCCYHTVDETSRTPSSRISGMSLSTARWNIGSNWRHGTRPQHTSTNRPSILSRPSEKWTSKLSSTSAAPSIRFPAPKPSPTSRSTSIRQGTRPSTLTGSCVGAPCWRCFRSRPSGVTTTASDGRMNR